MAPTFSERELTQLGHAMMSIKGPVEVRLDNEQE